MRTDTTVVSFPHPETLDDPLTSVLRDGARRLLTQAVEAEAEAFLAAMADERLADGRARVVRYGHGPERVIQTDIGAVPVKRAKLRDRAEETSGDDRITFTSAILPKWARRTKSRSRHGWSRRSLQDLPGQGKPVIVKLLLSRWR